MKLIKGKPAVVDLRRIQELVTTLIKRSRFKITKRIQPERFLKSSMIILFRSFNSLNTAIFWNFNFDNFFCSYTNVQDTTIENNLFSKLKHWYLNSNLMRQCFCKLSAAIFPWNHSCSLFSTVNVQCFPLVILVKNEFLLYINLAVIYFRMHSTVMKAKFIQ